ncbi:hypothetical protein PBT90_03980 [Algoriphagus halophytocola]|uniref:PepSY domain-containing protein n=1 Tax=Algoriphagus halophytocola TaxID=2991499 RepID=A0ABY6MFL4_9BACT|nr:MULTISPECIES: hypothetical protein [unclassified Algoriphagus]UZD22577.1 hypothetical protein OM944_18240 [Algoriphagus sp. TR-M5]WBL43843.1 hypothetical protein PBT90_03980 [Algoriphagus sp. TR-M9]
MLTLKLNKDMFKPLIIIFLIASTSIAVGLPLPDWNSEEVIQVMQEEKLKIDADALPPRVRGAIAADSNLAGFSIAEAWQIPQVDGKYLYEVKFDDESEDSITIVYNHLGKVVKK